MKLTRKSYKRKIIAIGVAAFISFALIATGFASWVLATAGEKEAEGNITIGTTTEKAIEISNIEFTDGKNDFVFEPKAGDLQGRVRYDGTNSENLTIEFFCTVSSASFVKNITVNFENLPQGIQDAVEKNYIIAPDLNINITADSTAAQTGELMFKDGTTGAGSWKYESVDGSTDVKKLSVTASFAWGEAFDGMNPSEYFDTDEGREAYPLISTVREILDTFKATIHEMTLEEYRATCFDENGQPIESAIEALGSPKYKIIIAATA